jgi:hypothetical protein
VERNSSFAGCFALLLLCSHGAVMFLNSVFLEADYTAGYSLPSLFAVTARVNKDVGPGVGLFGGKGEPRGVNV